MCESAGELMRYLPADFFSCYNILMLNTNEEIQKQVEERIRIQRIKNQTRACKDKLYEIAEKESN